MLNTYSQERKLTINLGGAPVSIAPASLNRTFLGIMSNSTAFSISIDPSNDGSQGIQVDATKFAELFLYRHGDMVRQEWFAGGLAGATTLTVFETFETFPYSVTGKMTLPNYMNVPSPWEIIDKQRQPSKKGVLRLANFRLLKNRIDL